MKKNVFLALVLLLSIGVTMAMNMPSGNIVKLEDPSGDITLRDQGTGFWVKYYPKENRYEGRTNIWHGTFQEGFGGSNPTEMGQVAPNQQELKDYYNSLNAKLEEAKQEIGQAYQTFYSPSFNQLK